MKALNLYSSRPLRNVLAFLSLACAPLLAGTYPIDRLVDESELIVVAKVSMGTPIVRGYLDWAQGEHPNLPYMHTASIIREIKGQCEKSITIKHFIGDGPYIGPVPGETQMLFLRHFKDIYIPVTHHLVAVPALEGPGALRRSDSTDLQVVMDEMGMVLVSPDATAESKDAVLFATLLGPPDEKFDQYLRAGYRTSDKWLQYRFMLTLINRNDISTLAEAQELLLGGTLQGRDEELLANAIGRLSNPGAVPVLKTLLKSPDPMLRNAAVEGMRHSAGMLEVPLLIDALDDPDQKVARGASSALWDITGKRVCDAQELRENLPFCVESWQQWAHRDPTK